MLAAGAGAGPAALLPAQPAAPALPRTTPPTPPVVTPQFEPEPSAPARKTTTELEMVLLAHQEQLALILHLAHEVQQSAAHNATITDALESAVRRIGRDLQVSLVSAVERVLEEVVEAIRISVGEVSGSTRRLESSTGPKLAEIREELRKVVKLLSRPPVVKTPRQMTRSTRSTRTRSRSINAGRTAAQAPCLTTSMTMMTRG